MIIFSSLVLLVPSGSVWGGASSDHPNSVQVNQASVLRFDLIVATLITSIIVLYLTYTVVKKGSKIGQKIVVHPQLIPEQLPN